MSTRTDKVPNTSATAASSGSDLNGAAVEDACVQIRARLAAVAAAVFDCDEAEVAFDDGGRLGARKIDRVRRAVRDGLQATRPAVCRRVLSHARHPLRLQDGAGPAVSLLRVRRRRVRSRSRRDSRASTACCAPTSCRTSAIRSHRWSIAVRSRADFFRGSAGSRSKSCCGTRKGASARRGRPPTSCRRGRRSPRYSTSRCCERATQPDVVIGQQGGGRAAADARDFGPRSHPRGRRRVRAGSGRTFDSPATPERIFFAVRRVRSEHPALK